MKSFTYILIIFSTLFLFSSCDDYFENFFRTETDEQSGFFNEEIITISNYINENKDRYSKFDTLMKEANIEKALNSYNPDGNNFTLFLPTDDAFDRFINSSDDYDTFDDLLNDKDYVVALMRYHVVMGEIQTNSFPFGALPDSTASGEYLTIGFEFGYDSVANEILYDSTVYKVNNEAPIIQPNIELINGYVHVINKILEPVVLSSYEWLKNEEGFTIITEAFEKTGLNDTMGIFRTTEGGRKVENIYTLLVEHDSVYHNNGIYTINDLIDTIVDDPTATDYKNIDNPLYQYTAYHILENRYFLDAFTSTNYNTYANFPVKVQADLDITINRGNKVYDTIVETPDTSIVNYINVFYNISNVLTKNGAIHFIDQMLEVYRPSPSVTWFQFAEEEPLIDELRNEIGEHPFFNDDAFEAIKWEGPDVLYYVKATEIDEASRDDYIRIDGDFTLEYQISKILPATYNVFLRANAQDFQNATIQISIDGNRLGSNFDLKSGGNPYDRINVGSVTFTSYSEHKIVIRSLIPGKFEWDYIQFEPI